MEHLADQFSIEKVAELVEIFNELKLNMDVKYITPTSAISLVI